MLYGNLQQLEYDFVVAPGADPDQIRLSVSGAEDLNIDEENREEANTIDSSKVDT